MCVGGMCVGGGGGGWGVGYVCVCVKFQMEARYQPGQVTQTKTCTSDDILGGAG